MTNTFKSGSSMFNGSGGTSDDKNADVQKPRSDFDLKFWDEQVRNALNNSHYKEYQKNAKSAVATYRGVKVGSESLVNLLFSNTQSVLSILMGRDPRAEIRKRYASFDDRVQSRAATILERCLNTTIEDEGVCDEVRLALRDAEVSGAGISMVRIEAVVKGRKQDKSYDEAGNLLEIKYTEMPTTETEMPLTQADGRIYKSTKDDGKSGGSTVPEGDGVVRAKVLGLKGDDEVTQSTKNKIFFERYDHNRVVWSPASSWRDVRWIAVKHYVDRRDLEGLASVNPELNKEKIDEILKQCKVDTESGMLATIGGENKAGAPKDGIARAMMLEIWDKVSKRRIYMIVGSPQDQSVKTSDAMPNTDNFPSFLIQWEDDPYRLKGFFPFPMFLLWHCHEYFYVPIPQYVFWQKLQQKLGMLQERVHSIADTIKAVGFYEASKKIDVEAISKAKDGQMIPVSIIPTGAGGQSTGALPITFLPFSEWTGTLNTMTQVVMFVKQLIEEVSGISDTMRGAPADRETATASSQRFASGGKKIQSRNQSLLRWIRSVFAMLGEAVCENSSAEDLAKMSGFEYREDAFAKATEHTLEEYLEQLSQEYAQAQEQLQQEAQGVQPDQQEQAQQMAEQKLQELEKKQSRAVEDFITARALYTLKDEHMRNLNLQIASDSNIIDEATENTEKIVQLFPLIQQLWQISAETLIQTKDPKSLSFFKALISLIVQNNKGGLQVTSALEEAYESLEGFVANMEEQPSEAEVDQARIKAEAEGKVIVEKVRGQNVIEAQKVKNDGTLKVEETKTGASAIQEQMKMSQKSPE